MSTIATYAAEPDGTLETRQRPGAAKAQARCPGCDQYAATFAIVLTTQGWRCDGCVSGAARVGNPLTMA